MSGRRLEPLAPEKWGDEEYAAFGQLRDLPAEEVPRVGSGEDFDPLRFPIVGVYMHHPKLAAAVMSLNAQLLRRGELDPRLRELAILNVAATRRSRYVWAEHVLVAGREGLTDDEIRRAADGPDTFAGSERLVLEATVELLGAGSVSEGTWRLLVDEVGTRAAMEVVILVGEYVTSAAAFTTWGVEPPEDAPELPQPSRPDASP